ncbi:cupin domain-containing protein [Ferruginibacter sp. SUN106]|uniref:cupin domain-containing protein n=1 Tax=Ferruginibacter sp. SUN106 TaxID=2978348 RepID=UPI003D36ED15
MQSVIIDTITTKEIVPGFTGKYYHADNLSIGWLDAKAGHTVPLHSHVHEQVSYVEEGKMLFIIEGEEFILEAGMAITVAPNLKHGATAITDCKLIDVFNPVREDYK